MNWGDGSPDPHRLPNGLNQDVALGHDAKGNITAIGASGYGYSSENLLTTAPGATLGYDPMGIAFATGREPPEARAANVERVKGIEPSS